LEDDELSLIAELKSMDEVMPRPTPDAQKELLDRVRDNAGAANEIDESIEEEFKIG
jgi:hypothetical protein